MNEMKNTTCRCYLNDAKYMKNITVNYIRVVKFIFTLKKKEKILEPTEKGNVHEFH